MFTKIKINNGYVYKAEYSEKMINCANWAAETACKKVDYTVDTWQRRPNRYAKFVDIYYGDFAKNIVKSFLLQNNPQLELEEYDLLRTDNFQNHDIFDLRLKGNEIEVKSSLEKYTQDLNQLYNCRRIIVNVNGPHQTLSDFVVQVFFVPDDLKHYESIEIDNKVNPNISNDIAIQKCNLEVAYSVENTSIYIMGWINKQQEQNAINMTNRNTGFGVKNYNSNAKYRNYANVMINSSNELDKLIDELTEIQNENG